MQPVPAHALDHRQHRGAIVEHAGLDGHYPQVGGDGIDLLRHELRWHGQDRRHAARILRRQRRQHAGAVDTEHGERLEVGLNARAAGRIRSGDGQGDGRLCVLRHALLRVTAAARRAA